MRTRTNIQTIVITIALLIMSINMANAATWIWVGPNNGDWTLAANWSPATVPDNNGTATIWMTNVVGNIDLDGDWDIDTLYVGGDDAMDVQLGNTDDTLTIRSLLYRHRYDPSWPYHAGNNQFNCKFVLGADGVVFYNDYGANYRYINTFTDNGNAYDWTIIGGFDMRDSGSTDQPSDFSGRIILKSSSLYMRADHGFPNCTEWVVSGNLYPLDSSDKLGDEAPIHLYGGQIAWNVVEDIGPVALASSMTSFRVAGGGTLQANSITRNSSTPGTRSLCSLQNGVGVTGFVKFDDPSGLNLVGGDGSRTTNKKIVPYMYDYVGSTDAFRTLITYDATNGLVELAASDFVTNTTANFPAVNADGNDNLLLSFAAAGSDTITLTGDTTVNSLVMHVGDANYNHTLDLGGFTLTIKSGVLIANNDTGIGGSSDTLTIDNGTIDVGNAEMILYSSIAGNYPYFQISSSVTITGNDGLTLYQSRTVMLQYNGPALSTLNLVGCGYQHIEPGTLATNAVVVGTLASHLSFGTSYNVLRPYDYGQSLVIGEAHGILFLKPGQNTQKGAEGLVIGGSSADHVKNHIRLLGNGVLSPHGCTISAPDQTEFDGGTIGMSSYDSSNNNWPTDAFTVDLHGGQVVIDIFDIDNYDNLRVVTSEFGDENLSLDAGSGTGSELVVRLHAVPDPADSFTIVQVDGATPIIGKFSNGDSVQTTYDGRIYAFDISYNADTGNDIVLSNGTLVPKGTLILIK